MPKIPLVKTPVLFNKATGSQVQVRDLVAAGGSAASQGIMYLDLNSYAWAWGSNSGFGNTVGDGTSTNLSSPVSVVGGRQWWSLGVAGPACFAALDSNSYAWSWGQNSVGALGNNTLISLSPTSIPGGRQFIRLVGGASNIAALDSLSYAWCWGEGAGGANGEGSVVVNRSSPVSVVGGRQWIALSMSRYSGPNAAALDSNSYAWCWGAGTSGQLGEGTAAVARSSPVSVVGGRQFIQISAGNPVVALDSNSYAWAWGVGSAGDNTNANRSSPVSVVGGRQFTRIQANNGVSYLIDANSYAWAWGGNGSGFLGDNTITARSSPVSVLGGYQFVKVILGQATAYGIRGDGTVLGWGSSTTNAMSTFPQVSTSSPISILTVNAVKNPFKP